jgi:hypothetical protein
MKIFISWSGPLSRQVAEVFRAWIPSVVQSVVPYVSSEDIDKGARWSADISRELSESDFGIICVTSGNIKAPWLNFEAGALSKEFDKSRVSPFLFGVDRNEVTGPLLQFQSTIFEHDDVLKLVKSINEACASALEIARLEQIFEVWWPELQKLLGGLKPEDADDANRKGAGSKRSSEDLLNEILALSRAQQKLISTPEELIPPRYLVEIIESSAARHSRGAIKEELYDRISAAYHPFHSVIMTFLDDTGSRSERNELHAAAHDFIERVEKALGIPPRRRALRDGDRVIHSQFRAELGKLGIPAERITLRGRVMTVRVVVEVAERLVATRVDTLERLHYLVGQFHPDFSRIRVIGENGGDLFDTGDPSVDQDRDTFRL